MLPTIKVASDKEGVKTIALPGPAYDDEAYVSFSVCELLGNGSDFTNATLKSPKIARIKHTCK